MWMLWWTRKPKPGGQDAPQERSSQLGLSPPHKASKDGQKTLREPPMGNREEMKMLENIDVNDRAFIPSVRAGEVGDIGTREHQGFLGTPWEDHLCLEVVVQISGVSKVSNIPP